MRDGYLSALQIAEGIVEVNGQPFPDSEGGMVTLNQAEAGALACASLGMSVPEIRERLDIWFDADLQVLWSAFRKLSGQEDLRRRAPFVAAAFDKRVYVSHTPPRLNPIRYSLRQRFFDLAARRAERSRIGEVGASVGIGEQSVFLSERLIALDLGLSEVKSRGVALVTLAGAANALPSQRNGERFVVEPSLLTPEPRTRPPDNGPFRPLPEYKTQKIIYNPTENFSNVLRFAGQPLELEAPDMHVGYLDEVRLCGAVIAVNDISFRDHEGAESWLTPIEMAALLLRTMLAPKAVRELTGHNGGETANRCGRGPLLRAYGKLLPPSEGQRHHSIEPAVRSAFEKRLLVPLRHADTSSLGKYLRGRLPVIGNSLAEGKGPVAAANELKISVAGVELNMRIIRETLNITTAGLALITEADRWLDKNAASPAVKALPEQVV
jgi:hypothetical protein